MKVVLFDLDHTLIRCDSFAGFNRELLTAAWWRLALTAAGAPVLGALWAHRRTRKAAGSGLLWVGTVLQRASLEDLVDDYARRTFADGALISPKALEQVAAHRRAGDRIVVVTGAAEVLARRVCELIQLGPVDVVGSTLKPRWGGWVAEEHCYATQKIPMLERRGVVAPWDCAYTDSASDLPLLENARRRVLVNPTPAARRRVAAKLGDRFEVAVWD